MKKSIVAAAAAAFALTVALVGCAQAPASSSSAPESSEAPVVVSEPSSSTSSASQSAATVKWTEVKSADEAAKGAGFEKFGVMDKIVADGMEFTKPKFAYAGNVAQALYEQGAAAIDVRKADGKHETPLTDRDKTEFANTWTKVVDDLDITLYGPAKGAATVITWAEGTKEYGVTYQGLGGEEMSFDTDEVSAIVKGIKEADAATKKEEPKQEEEKSEQSETVEPAFNVNDAVFNNGLGEFVSYSQVQLDDGNWYWAVVTRGADGNEYTNYFDLNGNLIQNGYAAANGGTTSENNLDQVDYEGVIWSNGLGEVISATQVEGTNGVWYWEVVTRGSDGTEVTHYIDEGGALADSSLAGGTVEGGMNLDQGDVQDIIWNNGYGQFEGMWYDTENHTWNVTVTDANGNQQNVVIDDATGAIIG